MAKHLVLVAGNIGAGKTSLTERIGARLDWKTSYKSVTDNPIYRIFMGICMRGHSTCKYFFLVIAPNNIWRSIRGHPFRILDRSIYEDFYIFTRALHQMGNMAEHEIIYLIVGYLSWWSKACPGPTC